jgi:hypothetical protein
VPEPASLAQASGMLRSSEELWLLALSSVGRHRSKFLHFVFDPREKRIDRAEGCS